MISDPAQTFQQGTSLYDLGAAVMWVIEGANVRVVYNGSPFETWVMHDAAVWFEAKRTSLGLGSGDPLTDSPHIFADGASFYDVRWASNWRPTYGGEGFLDVYYRGSPENVLIRHPQAAWLAVKEASLGNGG